MYTLTTPTLSEESSTNFSKYLFQFTAYYILASIVIIFLACIFKSHIDSTLLGTLVCSNTIVRKFIRDNNRYLNKSEQLKLMFIGTLIIFILSLTAVFLGALFFDYNEVRSNLMAAFFGLSLVVALESIGAFLILLVECKWLGKRLYKKYLKKRETNILKSS